MINLWFIQISLLCGCHASVRNKVFFQYNTIRTWKDAQVFCRQNHIDLATINDSLELQYANTGRYWIGMYRENTTSEWKWSRGDQQVQFYPKHIIEMVPPGNCMHKYNSIYYATRCHFRLQFICFDYQQLFLVEEEKTWEDALDHCRAIDQIYPSVISYNNHRFDLASLTNDLNKAHIMKLKANSQMTWIGMRFLGGHWKWVSGEEVLNLETCPDMGHCGALDKNSTEAFVISDCKSKLNFFCSRI